MGLIVFWVIMGIVVAMIAAHKERSGVLWFIPHNRNSRPAFLNANTQSGAIILFLQRSDTIGWSRGRCRLLQAARGAVTLGEQVPAFARQMSAGYTRLGVASINRS